MRLTISLPRRLKYNYCHVCCNNIITLLAALHRETGLIFKSDVALKRKFLRDRLQTNSQITSHTNITANNNVITNSNKSTN